MYRYTNKKIMYLISNCSRQLNSNGVTQRPIVVTVIYQLGEAVPVRRRERGDKCATIASSWRRLVHDR